MSRVPRSEAADVRLRGLHPGLPPVLFRYRPWSISIPDAPERKSIREIEGRFAYFSPPMVLNDPQDGLLGPEFAGGKGDIDRFFGHAVADAVRLARQNQCSITKLDPSDVRDPLRESRALLHLARGGAG